MEIFLNIIPQHFIRTENRRIIKHVQTFGAALKNICNIRNCYIKNCKIKNFLLVSFSFTKNKKKNSSTR